MEGPRGMRLDVRLEYKYIWYVTCQILGCKTYVYAFMYAVFIRFKCGLLMCGKCSCALVTLGYLSAGHGVPFEPLCHLDNVCFVSFD